MHIHILGICGTFMGGLALIARELGYQVSGSDQNVYPPMSTQLEEQGIKLMEGYKAENLAVKPDLVIIGNALSRGNAEVEAVLNQGIRYVSGPQWLSEAVLQNKWVLGVAGTHGKTTTTSMLSWILEHQGFKPGFLVGGIPMNFGISARLGESDFFVIEADEYDSAFFDKRSKFVHYRPRTAILNNLEYDHADIFPDLDAIKKQFHHLIRTVPGEGLIISPACELNIDDVLAMGCWTPVSRTSINGDSQWNAELVKIDGSQFKVCFEGQEQGMVDWALTGDHNVYNAMSAIVAAKHIGIKPSAAIEALAAFKNVKRRMEVIAKINGVTLYDDFAHHPTAVRETLQALRLRYPDDRLIAIYEPRSLTSRQRVFQHDYASAFVDADIAVIADLFDPSRFAEQDRLSTDELVGAIRERGTEAIFIPTADEIVWHLGPRLHAGDTVVVMSNGGFDGIHEKLMKSIGG